MMKKLLNKAIIFSVLPASMALTAYLVQSECYDLNFPYVDSACTPLYPCDEVVESGKYGCCIFAPSGLLGRVTCIEGDNYTHPYSDFVESKCRTIPCQYLGGERTYCVNGRYLKDSGFTDWVPDDTLSGPDCMGGA